MKRLIALILALMLCALPALAELWYTDDILEDGSLIYYFEDLSLTLPASWAGKVMAMEEETGTAFYHKASYEKYQEAGEAGGLLFRIAASVDTSFEELPSFAYLGFSEQSAMNYYLELPSDMQAWMEDAGIAAEYEAMAADIDAVVEGANFYGQDAAVEGGTTGPNDAAEAGETAAEAGSADEAVAAVPLEQARYHFEHRSLPGFFYSDPSAMLDALKDVDMYTLWDAFAKENGVAYPYQPEDYKMHWYGTGDGGTLLQVEMPQPDGNTLCYRIYLVCNEAAGVAGYYTVEYDTFSPDVAFMCGWTADGTHMNYGGMEVLDPQGEGFDEMIFVEAQQVAQLAGVSTELTAQ